MKLELELNVNIFELGALMLKRKLEPNVGTFDCGGIKVDIAASGRAREGDRLG